EQQTTAIMDMLLAKKRSVAHHQSKGPLFDRAFGVCWS
ncbi:hypothetical protein ACM6PT_24275, partial [Klebsiella pneumoniae]